MEEDAPVVAIGLYGLRSVRKRGEREEHARPDVLSISECIAHLGGLVKFLNALFFRRRTRSFSWAQSRLSRVNPKTNLADSQSVDRQKPERLRGREYGSDVLCSDCAIRRRWIWSQLGPSGSPASE